jgi:hypothetical protein
LPLPIISQEEEKFAGLFAVYNVVGNFIALTFEGDYVVDWGDGVTESFSSGVQAEHSYDYSSIDSETLSGRGYKQVIVTVTPDSGSNLTTLDINVRHSNSPAVSSNDLSTAWLDISFSMPYGESIYLSSGVDHYLGSLELARIVNSGNCSDFYELFYYCTALQEVVVEKMDYVEDISYMFEECNSLASVTLPDCPNLYYCSDVFYSVNSLRTASIGDISSVGDFSYFFYECGNLYSATVKKVSGSGSYAFEYCYSLREANILDPSELTDSYEMFYECYELESFHLPSAPLLEYTDYMFEYCYSLKSVSFESLPIVHSTYEMFYACGMLTTASFPELPLLEYAGSMFEYCYSLESYNLSSIPLCSSLEYTFHHCTSMYDLTVSGFAPGAYISEIARHCYKLQRIAIDGQPDYSDGAFRECSSLRSIIFTDCSLISYTDQMFIDCAQLLELRVPGMAVSFDISYCLLSRDALVQVFQDLGTVSGETIYVQGNWGTPFLSPSDIQIATDKGWSVSTT